MNLEQQLTAYKPLIVDYLSTFLAEQKTSLSGINSWGGDVVDRMQGFAGQGKVLRGSLVVATAAMYGKEVDDSVLAMAAAIELMHASLLVHDDIMDNDELRRGQPTLLAQYQQLGQDRGSRQSLAYGQALATCVGDLGFFMSWQLLSRSGQFSVELSNLFGREMAAVCLAQMEDVAGGLTDAELDETAITAIYRYKTARYTFSLPMMCGAMLADQPTEVLEQLESLGEYLGLMFQMKDDELGLFGDSQQTGKPVGSDIAENKKTLLRLWLLAKASDRQKSRLDSIFGSASITQSDVAMLRQMIEELGVLDRMDELMAKWAAAAEPLIAELAVADDQKAWLFELLEYNRQRTK